MATNSAPIVGLLIASPLFPISWHAVITPYDLGETVTSVGHNPQMTGSPALDALADSTLTYSVVRNERPTSVEESAAFQGIDVDRLLKTIVIRRAADDFVFVLVPGPLSIDWQKLRTHLGVSRISLPDAEEARNVTGYERGTITPFGSSNAWPVVADVSIAGKGKVAIGGGGHGINLHLDADELIAFLDADVADVTKELS